MKIHALKNLNILVTGASNGIGKHIAGQLMEQGAHVGIHYFRDGSGAEELLRDYPGTNSKCFKADLSRSEETIMLWEEVVRHFQKLDAIVLNAGVFEPHPTEMDDEAWLHIWQRTMAVNLLSAGILTKKGVAHFRSEGGGRIIYMGSRAAFRGETEEYLAYAASKGGLTSLGKSVARSFGKYNIKSFILAPGFVHTRMAQEFMEKYGEQRVLKELALKELTQPEDLVPLVLLMCSGLMDHATGTTIDLNAGSHIR